MEVDAIPMRLQLRVPPAPGLLAAEGDAALAPGLRIGLGVRALWARIHSGPGPKSGLHLGRKPVVSAHDRLELVVESSEVLRQRGADVIEVAREATTLRCQSFSETQVGESQRRELHVAVRLEVLDFRQLAEEAKAPACGRDEVQRPDGVATRDLFSPLPRRPGEHDQGARLPTATPRVSPADVPSLG